MIYIKTFEFDLLGGRVDHGRLPLGVEPAQGQSQDVLGDAIDHDVADLVDADPVETVQSMRGSDPDATLHYLARIRLMKQFPF